MKIFKTFWPFTSCILNFTSWRLGTFWKKQHSNWIFYSLITNNFVSRTSSNVQFWDVRHWDVRHCYDETFERGVRRSFKRRPVSSPYCRWTRWGMSTGNSASAPIIYSTQPSVKKNDICQRTTSLREQHLLTFACAYHSNDYRKFGIKVFLTHRHKSSPVSKF